MSENGLFDSPETAKRLKIALELLRKHGYTNNHASCCECWGVDGHKQGCKLAKVLQDDRREKYDTY